MWIGKYIKLQYDPDFRLVGARTEHFLLEKSRLVHLEESERSYHILYQVRAITTEAYTRTNWNSGRNQNRRVDTHELVGARAELHPTRDTEP